jgi:hypothetical protein
MKIKKKLKADLNCFVLWDKYFIGTAEVLKTIIPV